MPTLLVSASFRTKHEMKKILCGVLTRTTISGAGFHARPLYIAFHIAIIAGPGMPGPAFCRLF
jgi:hypothetical protein